MEESGRWLKFTKLLPPIVIHFGLLITLKSSNHPHIIDEEKGKPLIGKKGKIRSQETKS